MVKANNYKIINGSHQSVGKSVSELLQEGWQLYGNLKLTKNGTDVTYAQAMIHESITKSSGTKGESSITKRNSRKIISKRPTPRKPRMG